MRRSYALACLVGTIALGSSLVLACSGNGKNSGFDDPNGSSGGVNSSSGTFGDGTDGGGPGHVCSPNKANYDIPGNNCDDDGDGKVDNPPTCDGSGLGNSAEDFAKSLGICDKASDRGFGLVSATFTQGYQRTDAPNDQQHGVLPKFGDVIKPREGSSLGVLSTGYAQEYDGPGNAPFGGIDPNTGDYNGKDWHNASPNKGNGTAPPGFPKAATGCQQSNNVNDVIDIKLELKAPPNASGIKFDFNFYSGEWPAYICSPFNDGFIAYLSAKGFNKGQADNMSFDKNKNPVSVNNGFFDRCTANVKTGCASGSTSTSQCPGGTSELGGTGFGVSGKWCAFPGFSNPSNDTSANGGATGWLSSQAPVQPGETFTLELMIWDTGDGILDSSVLLDNFTWVEGQVTTDTERPK